MSSDFIPSLWVSHSSISEYLNCPRSYFLKNIYRDQHSGRKIGLVTPALTLGSAVHEVLDEISRLKVEERFQTPLLDRYEVVWKNYEGRRGGFSTLEEEEELKERGADMLKVVEASPGPLSNQAVRIKEIHEKLPDLPGYDLSLEERIILCGKIDWIEYLPDSRGVHIIDFKTSKKEEKKGSLQLPIYALLVSRCQRWPIHRMSYWYLGQGSELTEVSVPDIETAEQDILSIAREIKLARENRSFPCHRDGCWACRDMEAIRNGEAEFAYTDWKMKKDLYFLPSEKEVLKDVELMVAS